MLEIPICGITPLTLQDFPDHTAIILWFSGCNFRCPYCHNPDMVLRKTNIIAQGEIWDFLNSRIDLIDGVVLSGGECTLFNELPEFIKKVRNLGYKIKIDTNGSRFNVIKTLCDEQIVDYIALDYKAPIDKFEKITKSRTRESFIQSLNYLCQSSVPFEVRTTVHTSLLDEVDVSNIIEDLDERGFKGIFYVQNFTESKYPTLSCIPSQKRILDLQLLKTPKNFIVRTRNF